MTMIEFLSNNADTLFSGIGVFILGLIFPAMRYIPRVGTWFSEKFIKAGTSVETFSTIPGVYNDGFYNYFEECFKKAKNCIYITGDGFGCQDDENEQRANKVINMMTEALKREVKVIRLETKPNGSEKWARKLAKIKERFPETFQLYIASSTTDEQFSSFAIFDPDSKTQSVVEMMMSVSNVTGVETRQLAGMAIFIRNEIELAQELRNKIISSAGSDGYVEGKNPQDIISLISGYSLYFAYGSNMSSNRMLARTPSAEFVSVGMLKNHSLKFNRKGSYSSGGVASVEIANGDVWGVVWKISMSDMVDLTRIERGITDEIADPAYQAQKKPITLTDNSEVICDVYISNKQADFIAPTADYLNYIIDGAKEFNLPNDYIASLDNFSQDRG